MDTFPATDADRWAEACATCLRAGHLRELGSLLDAAPVSALRERVAFYTGHHALAQANYLGAADAFQQAAERAACPALAHTSTCWLAFTHTALGQYDLAAALLAPPPPVQASSVSQGVYWLALGLLASYRTALESGQTALEQALTLAKQESDLWLATLTRIILVSVYQHQGRLDRAMRLLRQIGYPDQLDSLEPIRQIQVRNMAVNCLRLMGHPEAACVWPLPSGTPLDSHRFAIWLALSVAMAATDTNDIALAERCWETARASTPGATDELGQAEIAWVGAWLWLRRGQLDEAEAYIQTALSWIDDLMDTDYLHVRAIAGIVALERGDLGMAACHLHAACVGFERIGHRMGLVGARIHLACYYWQTQQLEMARSTLAQIWSALHERGLMGAYYWHPSAMVTLCTLAISGDIWAGAGPVDEPTAGAWGDLAATLAAHRLARQHWRAFVPLLEDGRPNVQRRVQQVLRAADHPDADQILATQSRVRRCPQSPSVSRAGAPLNIHSFGTFRVLRDGEPIQVRRAGTRKVLVVLGILLLVGERGVESRDLALLLWPGGTESQQRSSLHSTISGLRAVLEDRDGKVLEAAAGRYYLHLPQANIWWDWAERHQRLPSAAERASSIGQLDDPTTFLEGFFDLIPQPPALPEELQRQWESLYEWLHELAATREAAVSAWHALEVHA
ncbi:hypothetical protein F8S13_26980 [Chloroflexia bacterium SDU3-3]|nr:hypothetical protein F8S13_26980 [Chloroflexia bacterium SDU3-3]